MLRTRHKVKLKSLKQYDKLVKLLTEYGYKHMGTDVRYERLYLFESVFVWKKQGWLYITEDGQFMAFACKSPVRYVKTTTFKGLRKLLEKNS